MTPQSKSRHQSAYPLSLALVLIYVYWHAISCSITFSCQTVNQWGSTVIGGNRIWITFCPHWLVYLHRDGDSGWAKDIIPGIWLCCHVSTVHVCALHQDVQHLNVDWVHRYSYSKGKWESNPLCLVRAICLIKAWVMISTSLNSATVNAFLTFTSNTAIFKLK